MKMSHPKNQRGLSLVELMIAITIGLILSAGIIQIFITNKQTFRMQEGMARLQESGRFAIDLMSRDLRMAGYYGCWSDTSAMVNTLADTTTVYNFAVGLEGENDTGVNGSDTITLRGAVANGLVLTTAMTSTTDDFKVQPVVPAPLAVGDIAAISDCNGLAVFQITGYTEADGSIVHDIGVETPGNATRDLGRRFSTDASVYRIATVQYFIANNADGEPELMRQIGADAPVALFEGVENMQILYGEDSDDDGSANRYLPADQVVDMNKVVSIRIALLIRTPEEIGGDPDTATYDLLGTVFDPADDRRMRRIYTTTIKLRNRGAMS